MVKMIGLWWKVIYKKTNYCWFKTIDFHFLLIRIIVHLVLKNLELGENKKLPVFQVSGLSKSFSTAHLTKPAVFLAPALASK